MSWIKVVLFNVMLSLALIGALLLTPPIIWTAYGLLGKGDENPEARSTESAANAEEKEWLRRYSSEVGQLTTTYHDYITWRRDDFAGEIINIENGRRRTVGDIQPGRREVWFFGGSTTWGSGVDDANTYPSIFQQRTGSHVENMGEGAYIARQSLAYLQNAYILETETASKPRLVVFYDGVNDVSHRCRSEIGDLGSGREAQIRSILKDREGRAHELSFLATFEQVRLLLEKVLHRVTPESELAKSFDCVTDTAKAHFVAHTLVEAWVQAKHVAEGNGDDFIAILQPVAFVGQPVLGELSKTDANISNSNGLGLRDQYGAVYPLIEEYAREADLRFFDLTKVYDGCEGCYIDFAHASGKAHELLVDEMIARFGSQL